VAQRRQQQASSSAGDCSECRIGLLLYQHQLNQMFQMQYDPL
jgi:hypothetical protein